MSDLGGVKLDLGLVDVAMAAVLLHGVRSAFDGDMMTHSYMFTKEKVQYISFGGHHHDGARQSLGL